MLNKSPSHYSLTATGLTLSARDCFFCKKPMEDCVHTEIDGQWVSARPLGMYSLVNRVRLAWGVFTGKYYALSWPKGQ